MKKILLYVAAMAAFAACTKADVDDPTPEVGDVVSVSVIAEGDDADTRVSFANDWTISWDEGDALLAINGGGTTTKFTMTSYHATNPTFSGESLSDSYCLIYPYSVVDYQINSGGTAFNLDLTTQSEGAKHTYMISEEYIASGITSTDVTMKHLGAAAVLEVTSADYDGYTIEKVEVSGLNSKAQMDVTWRFNNDFDKLLSSNDLTSNTITITDGSTTIASEGAEVRFNIFATTIASDGSVDINFYLSKGDESVILTKSIANTSGSDFEFGRATYTTLACSLSSSDEVLFWDGTTATSFSDGDGDSEDTAYKISTAAELALLSANIASGTDNTSYYELTANLNLSGYEFTPIGDDNNSFKGTFDGGDHTISGLTINQTNANASEGYYGLFGYTDGATVKNLAVSGSVAFNYDYVSGYPYFYVGGVVGYADNNTTVTNCSFSGSVEGDDRSNVGGVVGWAEYSTVTDCYNSASISTANAANNGSFGGVVGYTWSSTVAYCYNSGSIYVEGDSDFVVVGGIIGGSGDYSDTLINCYNNGTVESEGPVNIGGVVGYIAYSCVVNCYNSASVIGNSSYTIGGLIGYNDGTFTNCYNSGSVEDNSSTHIGGIVGEIGIGSFENCYWDKLIYTGEGSGYGSSYVTGYETSYMQGASFVITLDNNAAAYNNSLGDGSTTLRACAWVEVSGDYYPTLDFNNTNPTASLD